MAKALNLSMIDEAIEKDPKMARMDEGWDRRAADPTVQMSVRMQSQTYKRFRKLCALERRTNGDMLEILLQHYLTSQEG